MLAPGELALEASLVLAASQDTPTHVYTLARSRNAYLGQRCMTRDIMYRDSSPRKSGHDSCNSTWRKERGEGNPVYKYTERDAGGLGYFLKEFIHIC